MEEIVDLERVRVELVTETLDIAQLETMLSREHPLGWRKAQGKRLYYAVVYKGNWIGALLFDGAVMRNRMRAQEIGWTPQQESERREHICNNSRFLVRPDYQSVPNLASKILGLVGQRIAGDWLRRYGVPLLAMETYVDPERNDNQGSCYRAAGWSRLGMSSGYEKSKGERTHGKWYFLKPLHEDSYKALRSEIPHALLTGVKPVSGESNNNFVLDASKFRIDELKKALSQITDPRKRRGIQYLFVPFLALCIAAVVSGSTQYRQIADWIKNLGAPTRARFGLRGDRCPGEGAVGKLLRQIDPEEFGKVLSQWLFSTYPEIAQGTVLSLDGKALRGTDSDMAKQVSLLNIFANEVGIVIEQLPTTKGSGEKASARAFAENAEHLSGKIVMGDAMLTDSKLIDILEKKNAYYLFPVKDNNPSLKSQIELLFSRAEVKHPSALYSAITVDKGHGRLEEREISVLSAEKQLLQIFGIKQVAKLVRTREVLKKSKSKKNEKTTETVYLITNLSFEQASAEQLLSLKTQYWGIENKVHYVADNVFGEDRCTIRKGHGPRNMSALRMFAMNVMRACSITNIKRCVDNLRSNPLKLLAKAA